jgi:hypothetical protein
MDMGKSKRADRQKRFLTAGDAADPANVQLQCVDGNITILPTYMIRTLF